ncbi:MAG: nucleotidyltransferase domain-containing protein [Immundisolibacterales bacterium]|nr:nucleotidyltransferase domain-containing protein [Immundisolibacterales bacterium]
MDREKIAPDQYLAGVVARFASVVRERFGESVIDIRLFGSYARSSAHEDSDVDVAVVLEDAGWATRRDIIDLAADIGLEHDLVLSPTVFDRVTYERWRAQDRALVRDIETEGIRV